MGIMEVTDLVDRCRLIADVDETFPVAKKLLIEAADEIERLRDKSKPFEERSNE